MGTKRCVCAYTHLFSVTIENCQFTNRKKKYSTYRKCCALFYPSGIAGVPISKWNIKK